MQAALVITASSSVTPYGLGSQAYTTGAAQGMVPFAPLQGSYSGTPNVALVPGYDAQKLLAVRSVSNFDRLTLHVCVAIDQLHKRLGFTDIEQRRKVLADDRMCIVLGSAGPLQSIVDFDLQTIEEPSYVQPSRVPNVVFNVPASYAAIRHGIRGSCITLTDGDTSSMKALAVAASQLEFGRIDLAMVGGAEEATPAYAMYRQALDGLSDSLERPISEGAAFFSLETALHAKAAGRPSIAGLFGCVQVFSPDDPLAGLVACLAQLRRKHDKAMREIDAIYMDANLELAALGLSDCRVVQLEKRLGSTGAMYGSMALLDLLASPSIAPGSQVLVMQVDGAGCCAAALFQKHAYLD